MQVIIFHRFIELHLCLHQMLTSLIVNMKYTSKQEEELQKSPTGSW